MSLFCRTLLCLSLILLTTASPLLAREPLPRNPSAIDIRQSEETLAERNRFSLLPYKQNYILPLAYNNRPENDAYPPDEANIDRLELKFQLSFKIPLVKGVLKGHGNLFAGYTQQSFWQAYNGDESSPFRETNYEPELYLDFPVEASLFGLRSRFVTLGLSHQSNGRSEPLSRSWNRVYALVAFERGNFYCALRPWLRIPESHSDDDNPDIDDYLGHGEAYALYLHNEHRLGLMLRNNLRSENRVGVLLDWSFPIKGKKLHGYLQLFHGYGESLIDYNQLNNRVGLGIIVSNWL